jgi:hypothetical protein
MIITRDNYEPFFLDYLEGNLHENMIDQFLDFLEQNPDLKEELHLFENIHLPEEQVVYSGKEHLYKSVQDEKVVFERKAVAFMEGDLKDEERSSFETYLASHPELQKEYNLFTKTRFVADAGIKYPDKQKLYRKSGTTIVLKWVTRAAAVVVLIWGISSLFQTGSQKVQPNTVQEIASLKSRPITPIIKIEPEKKNQEVEIAEKPAVKASRKSASIQEQTKNKPEQNRAENAISPERDFADLQEITPILAVLEVEPIENQLAVSRSINVQKINDPRNVMTIEEFLASRAKKVSNEGFLSAQRIFRSGLTVASELSGERIGYKVKNGKISSLEFESRLMAFSIPLQKK